MAIYGSHSVRLMFQEYNVAQEFTGYIPISKVTDPKLITVYGMRGTVETNGQYLPNLNANCPVFFDTSIIGPAQTYAVSAS